MTSQSNAGKSRMSRFSGASASQMIARFHETRFGPIRRAGFSGRCAPFLLAAALAGCASYSTEPSPEAQRAAWEARNLYPQSYRSEILAYMRNYFNDPRNVRDAVVSEPELKPMGLGNRYVSCLRYGLKNAAGAGPPGREHVVIFVGGKLDALRDAKDQCAGAAYTAFPELERLTR
jgi:hypothetical protein